MRPSLTRQPTIARVCAGIVPSGPPSASSRHRRIVGPGGRPGGVRYRNAPYATVRKSPSLKHLVRSSGQPKAVRELTVTSNGAIAHPVRILKVQIRRDLR